jgi:DtxR family Mn-dependent transcriptional regulator
MHHLGADQQLVTPAEIAFELSVRAPSVTGMLKRLHEAGHVLYESGKGARFTEQGLLHARRVIRRHRLVELFLHRVLGLDWSEVDSEAERLEHVISPRLERAIAEHLGEPLEDPHGHLIPTDAGQLATRNLRPFASFSPGDMVLIREVRDDNPDRLRRWKELGLVPGVAVHLVSYQELDDVYELEIAGRLIRLGSEGIDGLRGESVSVSA